MALRFGPRHTAAGVALLSLAFLAQLWTLGPVLPDEAFRFSQLHLLVLALAAFVSSAAAEEARLARLALETRDLQAQRMEAVGTLAGGLVHEFNNQLTVVLGNLDRLRAHLPPGDEAPDLAWRLEEAALSMGSTVQQLKALSHQVPLQTQPLPIREALVPFLAIAQDLPGRIAFHVQVDENPVVGLEPELLTQALQRLLANSVQAIPGQGHITLRVWREDTWVHLALEDDGLGMSPEVLQRACDPFYTTKPQATSRGLGLSIAFALVRQLGGQLLLDSQPGRGTRAEFVLPLAPADQMRGATSPAAPRTGRILLADDESGIRELARAFLQEEGFVVQEAADGQEALEAFLADPQGWDLVILDLVMPRLGGAEALNRIQALRPDLPVLLMSGYSTDGRSGLLDGPHRGFLSKPFRLQELRQAIQDLGLSPSTGGTSHGG
ncbi:MAG TPA: response regulator, partial [Geothrix sp.]|nr:response regulator [Geothrix sp.]